MPQDGADAVRQLRLAHPPEHALVDRFKVFVVFRIPHIVKLMVLVTDPPWISLLLLSSARAKPLYLDVLVLLRHRRNKLSGFTFVEDSQE